MPRKILLALLLTVVLALEIGVFWLQSRTPATSSPRPAALQAIRAEVSTGGVRFQGEGWFRVSLFTPAGPLVEEGEGEVFIPYRRAGLIPYRLEAGSASLEGTLRRRPGPATTPLRPKVGARAVRIDTPRQPSLVLHPLDAQLNVAEEPVRMKVFYPDGSQREWVLPVVHQLAWSYFPPGSRKGILKVVVQSGAARGERAEVDVLPGRIRSGALVLLQPEAATSGRDRWVLEVQGLRDEKGNLASDGLAVSLIGGALENLFLTRSAPQSRLPLSLPLPDRVGSYPLRAWSEGWVSNEATLRARPAVQVAHLPLYWSGNQLHIGPVVDDLGALPDDGTPMRLRVVDPAGRLLLEERILLASGQALWTPPPLTRPFWLEVELAGQRARLEVPRP
ncbi:MAG: hypothetical protein KatS3mg070_0663 [Meiothermus sp.]|uniref:hypothetical protein n=1 Tax=Meiothermus sp. TaxID=1955249 RepID=UPI0021DBD56C|nr:hypothetical protein [Meiothermus sp.]GIW27300.1 MAG: hypothetical protein KatS3mg070_0663 [Meiothermus sp.]